MSTNKKFVTTLFDIFGYSFIGIIAYIFGLVLQNYISENELIHELFSYGNFAPPLILLFIFQIIFTCLFGFSYATVFFNKAEIKESESKDTFVRIYQVAGNWIEVILICFITAVIVFDIVSPDIIKSTFWHVVLFSSVPYVISSMVYRMKFRNITDTNIEWLHEAKYVLVCPAILTIGVNIYLGGSVLSLLKGEMINYIPICIFVLFLVSLFASKKAILDKLFYIVFSSILIVVGLFCYNELCSIPFRNMFLAVMVSIFLSVFECWYISFRQLKGQQNRAYINVTSFVVIITPPVVIALYPLQNFNLVYIISFFIGMIATQFIWFSYIYPKLNNQEALSEKENRRLRSITGWLRTAFGILVLFFLAMDKHIGDFSNSFRLVVNINTSINYDSFGVYLTAIIPLGCSLLPFVLKKYKTGKFLYNQICEPTRSELFCFRIFLYTFSMIVLFGIYRFAPILDIFKFDISFFFLVSYFLVDGITAFCYSRVEKDE